MAKTLLRTETVKSGDAEIEVESATLLTEVRKRQLADVLTSQDGIESTLIPAYTDAVVQTRKAKGLGFQLPEYSAEADVHVKAFERFVRLPLNLTSLWLNALFKVNLPPNMDELLLPGVNSKDPKSEGDVPINSAE